jgi:hypothetical protein
MMKSSNSFPPNKCFIKAISILACVLISLSLIGKQTASAGPPTIHYYVDTTTDSNAAGYQVCDTDLTNNNCSLRGAISKANAYVVNNTDIHEIHLLATTYPLTIAGSNENNNATGDLDTRVNPIVISGAGKEDTTISAQDINDRVIDELAGSSLTLVDLTIGYGNLASGLGGGGGIRSLYSSHMQLQDVKVFMNTVSGSNSNDSGGGIFAQNSHLSITNSNILFNSACHGGGVWVANDSLEHIVFDHSATAYNTARCGNGGGIYITGIADVTMYYSGSTYNHAKAGGGYYDSENTQLTGTGVLMQSNIIDESGTGAAGMEIFGSASISIADVYENIADTGAGGIRLNPASTFTLSNAAISLNQGGDAGGLWAFGNTSALLQQVEITSNSAVTGGGISVTSSGNIDLENVTFAENEAVDYGGGLYLLNNTSADLDHVTIASNISGSFGDAVYIGNNGDWSSKNSIISSELDGDVCHYETIYSVLSSGHNIISDDTCRLSAGTDSPDTDPVLGSLGFYGHGRQTMPLLPGSPAIDGALESDPITTDQNGVSRLDGDRDGVIKSDIGAHEAEIIWSFLSLLIKP